MAFRLPIVRMMGEVVGAFVMAKSRQLYLDVASHAEIPLANRKEVVSGRGGELRVPRRYHLKADKLIALRNQMKESGHFISPYGANRLYTFIIEALSELGTNKPHACNVVWEKFKEVASRPGTTKAGKTAWERFSERPSRSATTGLDDFSRFLQNLEVLQRLGGDHPYGFKLSQVGACIDILMDIETGMKVQLRTGITDGEPVKPVNMSRKRVYKKTVDFIPAGTLIDAVFSDDEGASEESED